MSSKHKHMRLNPILKKELMVGSRNMKMSWAIFGMNAFLSLIALITMYTLELNSIYSGYSYSDLVALFPILGIVEVVMLSLLIPVITSGSISGERERQTLDIMLTTPVKPFSIAIGKLGSALMLVMMYMISSVPVLSIAFIMGGLSWTSLLGLMLIMLYLGIYIGSIGIFCSSALKRSMGATVLTILIVFAIGAVTLVLFFVIVYAQVIAVSLGTATSFSISAEPILLMFNPYAPVVDFFLQATSSTSVYSIINATTSSGLKGGLKILYENWVWVSAALNLLVSFGFLRLASRNIAATHNRRGKKRKDS